MQFQIGQLSQRTLVIATWSLACFLAIVAAAAPEDEGEKKVRTIAVITHPESEIQSLSRSELARMFKKAQTEWADGTRCIPIDQLAGSEIRADFSRLVLREGLDDIKRFWMQQTMTGSARPPIALENSDTIKKYVAKLPGAVAYVYLDEVDENTRVLAVADVPELATPAPETKPPADQPPADDASTAPPPEPADEVPAE